MTKDGGKEVDNGIQEMGREQNKCMGGNCMKI